MPNPFNIMESKNKLWPRVPSGFAIPSKGSSVGSGGLRGAKNLWGLTSCPKLMKRKTKIAVASYNVRTLRTDDRLEELFYELEKIAWGVVGLSEVRRSGEACLELHRGHLLYYRGAEDSHEHGVALLVNKDIKHNIMEINSMSDRVIYAVLRVSTHITLKVIQTYLPTGAAADDDIETVYEDISRCMRENQSTYTILTGDFNAKIGVKADDSESFMGDFGYGTRNSRGHMLTNFLVKEGLYHMSSFYQKRPQRKWTWVSPSGKHFNEIDYIFSTHKSIIKDVSVLSNFNTGSDHRLIRATLVIDARLMRFSKIRAKKTKIDPIVLGLNKDIYQQKIQERLLEVDDDTSVDELSQHLQRTLYEVAKEITPKGLNNHPKLRDKTKELLEERRQLINQGFNNTNKFKLLCKEVRKCVEEDVEEYRERTVKSIIEKHKGPKVFRNALSIGKQRIAKLVDQHGDLITEKTKLLRAVEEFYGQLYTSKSANLTTSIARTIVNVGSEDVPDITNTEIKYALGKMKNNKASGEDGVIVEMIKEGGDMVVQFLNKLLNRCLEEGNVPKEWECSNVILLFKKGNKADLNNYRPISLLSQLYKLLTKIITIRLTNKFDFYQPVEQAGFRSGFSTMDHILTMRIIIEKATEYQFPLWLAFIDYKKAFDSVESWAVVQSLQNARIDHRYTKLIKNIYDNATMKVILTESTEPIPIKRGVRQGDTLSPKLFTLVLEDIFKKLAWEQRGINISGVRLNNLRFADDIVLLTNNPEELQIMIQELSDVSLQVGLEMNLDKTKIMTNVDGFKNITVNQITIEQVEKYVYLGQEIRMGKSNQTNELNRRIRLMWAAYSRLDFAFKMRISAEQKARIFNQCILPVLTHGAETWVFTKDIINRLEVAQRAVERKLVGVSLTDRKTNKWLREQSKVADVTERVAHLKWKWAGHVARNKESWCRVLLEWKPWGEKRPQGRPQMRWKDDIGRVAGSNWIQRAQDRNRWNMLKEAYTVKVEKG